MRLLGLYEAERAASEPARDFFRRVEAGRVKSLLSDLVEFEKNAAPEDFRDLGSDQPFRAETGEGECAA